MVFAARFSYLGEYWYNSILEEMEKEGRIKFVMSEDFFKYDQLVESVGKFSRTPVKVLVYKKMKNVSELHRQKSFMTNST